MPPEVYAQQQQQFFMAHSGGMLQPQGPPGMQYMGAGMDPYHMYAGMDSYHSLPYGLPQAPHDAAHCMLCS